MPDPCKKIPKKVAKKFKKLKNLFQEIFLAKTGWHKPRKGEKNFRPDSAYTGPREENSEKNGMKIQKI